MSPSWEQRARMQHLPRRWQGRAGAPVPPAPGRVFRLARGGRGMNVSHVRRLLSPVIAIVPRCGQASHPEQSKTRPPASMQAASPCTWAAAVCQHVCSKRNETRRARPLLAGRARVCTEPKALAAGTAGTQADSPLPVGWEHVRRQSRRRRLTAKQGRVRRQAEQGMR